MTRTARVQPGDTPANPITGERSTVTGTAATANGELVVVELDLRPGGAVPMPRVRGEVRPRSTHLAGGCHGATQARIPEEVTIMNTRKTPIEGGSAWRWYAEPAADRDYLAMATFIELGSVWQLPRFEWYTLRVHRQLARTPGLAGYSFRAEFPLRYWTISAWQNGRALHGFVRAGTHRSVMAALPATTRRFRHTHWTVTGAELPLAWTDALHRLDRADLASTAHPARTPQ